MSTKEKFELNAEKRTEQGTGASRRLRRQGKIPAIMYGSNKDPMLLSISHNELAKHLQSESFYSSLLTIKIGDKKQQAVLKDLQRHPFRPKILHLDLMRVSKTKKIEMHVPIHFVNEEQCHGVKLEGGVISHHVVEVEIRCLPKDLPEFIDVDVGQMKIGDILHLSDLKCPKNVELIALQSSNDLAVVSVQVTRAAAAGDEEGEAEETSEESEDKEK